MGKFNIGEKIKGIRIGFHHYKLFGKIIGISDDKDDPYLVDWDDGDCKGIHYNETEIAKIGGDPMSLRTRIEALDNGWDKEADDILKEMEFIPNTDRQFYRFDIGLSAMTVKHSNTKCGWDGFTTTMTFSYENQCSKMTAFKDAFLWLLYKSGLEAHKKGDNITIESEGKTYKVKILEEVE